MDGIISALNEFAPYIIIGLIAVTVIFLIIIIVMLRAIGSLEKRYRKLTRGVNNQNLEEIIIGYMDKVDSAVKISEGTKEHLTQIGKRIDGCIQKVAITRFRAFDDVGSDLSFSVALLDSSNDGVILTGIYGRHDSTTYAKPIDKGISRYDLSEEEKAVLDEAMNKKS